MTPEGDTAVDEKPPGKRSYSTSMKRSIQSSQNLELGLEGEPKDIAVSVLNDNQETFSSAVMDFQISKLDGNIYKNASAFTTRDRRYACCGLAETQVELETFGEH